MHKAVLGVFIHYVKMIFNIKIYIKMIDYNCFKGVLGRRYW